MRGFWVTLGMLAAVAPAVVAAATGAVWLAVAAAALGIAVASVSRLHERVAWRVYRAWNPRLARPFNAAATRLVCWICFFIIFVAVGKAGTTLQLAKAPGSRRSMWRPVPGSTAAIHGTHWISDYVGWAAHTGNVWAITLIPFLAVLRLIATPEDANTTFANIYTLF